MAQVFRGRYSARIDELFCRFPDWNAYQPTVSRAQRDACRGTHASDASGAQEESRQGSAWPGKLDTVAGSNECAVLAEF